MSKWDLESPFRPILLRSWHAGNECQEGLECLVVISVLKMVRILHVALADMMWLFMLSSNRAKKWFNVIFDSELTPEYSYKMIFLKEKSEKRFVENYQIGYLSKNSVTTVVIVDLWLLILFGILFGHSGLNPLYRKMVFCPKWPK